MSSTPTSTRSIGGSTATTFTDEIIEFVNFKVTAIGPTENPSVRELDVDGPSRCRKGRRDGLLPPARMAGTTRPSTSGARCPPGHRSWGRRSSKSRWRRPLVHPGETLDVDDIGNLLLRTSAGRLIDGCAGSGTSDRPGNAPGRQQLSGDDRTRDGDRDAKHVVLAPVQRGSRLLVRALRRAAAR